MTISDLTFGLKHDPFGYEGQGRTSGASVDTLVQRAHGYIQTIGVLLHRMLGCIVHLKHPSELHEQPVGRFESVQLQFARLVTVTVNLDQEDFKQ